MAVRDEDFGADLTLVESGDGIWSPSEAASARAPRDWRSEYEREHARAERERARADAAEARCEELRWAEVDLSTPVEDSAEGRRKRLPPGLVV